MAKILENNNIIREDFATDIRNALLANGYSYLNPAIIQEAEHFIELSGENIRRRLYSVNNPDGYDELCLRPEFTIPIIKEFSKSNDAKSHDTSRFCYSGPVFRYGKNSDGSQSTNDAYQAGVELFSANSSVEYEIETLSAIIDVLKLKGFETIELTLGDFSIFNAIIDRLDISHFWKSSFKRRFYHKRALISKNDFLRDANVEIDVLIKTIQGKDEHEAISMVKELLANKQILDFGGRSAEDIALRLMAKADSIYGKNPRDVMVDELIKFSEISGSLDEVIVQLFELSTRLNIDIDDKIDEIKVRYSMLICAITKKHGSGVSFKFHTSFDSKFEYYSGFVFSIDAPSAGERLPIAHGGRYDRLLKKMGISNFSAVGGSIYIDNLITAIRG